MAALLPCAVLAAAGGASAKHDTDRVFAGTWTTKVQTPVGEKTGTISFRAVPAAEGEAAIQAMGVSKGLRNHYCWSSSPGQYYVGTYRGGIGEGYTLATSRAPAPPDGIHAGCMELSGFGESYKGWFENSNPEFIEGQLRLYTGASGIAPDSRWHYGDFGAHTHGVEGSFAGHFGGDGSQSGRACGAPLRRPAVAGAINEVRVVRVTPEAEYRCPRDPRWYALHRYTVLQQGNEISTDPDGEIVLAFADNSTVTIRNSTQLRIASFFTEGGVVRTLLILSMGEVSAKVNKSQTTRSDFVIKAPTCCGSVRGTVFSVFTDGKTSVWSVREGVVVVDPPGRGRALVRAGREVAMTGSRLSKMAAIGRAGTPPGALSRAKARALVLRALARLDERCRFDVVAFRITPIRRGWRIRVRLTGRVRGWASWNVVGTRVAPGDPFSGELASGKC